MRNRLTLIGLLAPQSYVDDLRASVYYQMATCERDHVRDLMIDRDFRLGIGANQLLGLQSTLSARRRRRRNIAEHSVKQWTNIFDCVYINFRS